jgi:GTP cyclohydrolase I
MVNMAQFAAIDAGALRNAVLDPHRRGEREAAEAAVRALIRWAGDDPEREGLAETPARVARAFEAYFSGYGLDPVKELSRTFSESAGYSEPVLLKDIAFVSHCEHHLAPIRGKAHVAYMPRDRVVGISKLARTVDIFARRLQLQERMTAQIGQAIQESLEPRGVAVVVDASHGCMTMRGVNKPDTVLRTSFWLGEFAGDPQAKKNLLDAIGPAQL